MLYVGEDPISKLYLGDDEISELYQGNDPIYSDNSAIEEKIVLQLLSDDNSYIQYPIWEGIHFRVYGNDGSSDEGTIYNMSGPTGEGRGQWGTNVNNPRNVYFIEYTPITDGSYEGHTEPRYGWAKGMCNCGQYEYQGYGYPRVTRIVYDKTYMGFADSATNTGDNFRSYQYCNMQNLQNCATEYLPDTVTSIGESFRNMQYAQAGIINVAAEFMPDSVTHIGGNFRIYQYYLCHNLIEAAYEIISPNVSTIENHFRFGQYADCPNITSAVPERLPNVTSISYNFRGQQYMSTGVRKSADEYIPNTVTSIREDFRYEQYRDCFSLSEVGQLSNGGNNTIISSENLRYHQFFNCGYIQEIEIPSLKWQGYSDPYYEVLKEHTENLSKITVHAGIMYSSIIGFIQNSWSTASSVTNFTLKIIGGYGVMVDDYQRRSAIVVPQGTRYLDVPSYLYNDYINSDWANYFTIIQHQEQAPTSFINITSINTTSPSPITIGSVSGNFEIFPSNLVASPQASGQSGVYGGTACCVGNISRTFEINNITYPGTYTVTIDDFNNPGLFDTEQISLGGCEYGKISPIANDSNPTYANIEYYNAFHGEEHSGYNLYIISPYQDVTTLVVNTTDSNVAYIDNITTYSVSGSSGEYSYASIWLQCINTGTATLTYYTLVHPDDVRTLEVTVGNPPQPSFSPSNNILLEQTRGSANIKFFAEDSDSQDYVGASLIDNELTNISYYGLCEGDAYCEGMFGDSDVCSLLANSIGDYLDEHGIPASGAMEFNEGVYGEIERYFNGEDTIGEVIQAMENASEIVEPVEVHYEWSNASVALDPESPEGEYDIWNGAIYLCSAYCDGIRYTARCYVDEESGDLTCDVSYEEGGDENVANQMQQRLLWYEYDEETGMDIISPDYLFYTFTWINYMIDQGYESYFNRQQTGEILLLILSESLNEILKYKRDGLQLGYEEDYRDEEHQSYYSTFHGYYFYQPEGDYEGGYMIQRTDDRYMYHDADFQYIVENELDGLKDLPYGNIYMPLNYFNIIENIPYHYEALEDFSINSYPNSDISEITILYSFNREIYFSFHPRLATDTDATYVIADNSIVSMGGYNGQLLTGIGVGDTTITITIGNITKILTVHVVREDVLYRGENGTIIRDVIDRTITYNYTGDDSTLLEKPTIIIADRNIGSTGDTSGDSGYIGKSFQRGNNWYPTGYPIPEFTEQIDASNYGPLNPFYLESRYTGNETNWDSSDNHNLWGGYSDGGVIGSEIERKGPCPVGYHIPTTTELQYVSTLIKAITGIYNYTTASIKGYWNLYLSWMNTMWGCESGTNTGQVVDLIGNTTSVDKKGNNYIRPFKNTTQATLINEVSADENIVNLCSASNDQVLFYEIETDAETGDTIFSTKDGIISGGSFALKALFNMFTMDDVSNMFGELEGGDMQWKSSARTIIEGLYNNPAPTMTDVNTAYNSLEALIPEDYYLGYLLEAPAEPLIEYEDAIALYNTDPNGARDLVNRLNENPEAQYEKFLSEGHVEETYEGGDRMLIGTGNDGEYVLYGVGEWNYHEWYLAA